jgi:hypothetical protein
MENKPTETDEKGGHWIVVNSFVRDNKAGKITSLVVCYPKRPQGYMQLTFSVKDAEKIRIKMSIDEVAGLANALALEKTWKAFHTFEKEGSKMETAVEYNNSFINAVRNGNKIAIKLSENETASLQMALKVCAYNLMEAKIRG